MKWKILSSAFLYRLVQNIIGGTRARKLAIRKLSSVIDFAKEIRILDIGCGVGDVLSFLPNNVLYSGIDLSPRYINLAVATWGKRGRFYNGDVCSLKTNFSKKSFDVVLFLGVLHHLNDDEALCALLNAQECLRDDGFIYALEPAFVPNQSLSSLFFMKMDRGRYIRDIQEWKILCSKCFQLVQVDPLSNALRIPYHKVTLFLK